MKDYLDSERNPIEEGMTVAVWDNYYKCMFRAKVIGFTKVKVKLKPIDPPISYVTVIKFPGDLLII